MDYLSLKTTLRSLRRHCNKTRSRISSAVVIGVIVIYPILVAGGETGGLVPLGPSVGIEGDWPDRRVSLTGQFRVSEPLDCGDVMTGEADLMLDDRQTGNSVTLTSVRFGLDNTKYCTGYEKYNGLNEPRCHVKPSESFDVTLGSGQSHLQPIDPESWVGPGKLGLDLPGYGVSLLDIDEDGSDEIIITSPCGERQTTHAQIYEWDLPNSTAELIFSGRLPHFDNGTPRRMYSHSSWCACCSEFYTYVASGDRFRLEKTEEIFEYPTSRPRGCYKAVIESDWLRSTLSSIESVFGYDVRSWVLWRLFSEPLD